MPNWYDLGFKTENGNMQTTTDDDVYQIGSASGVASQNNVITNIAVFENGTSIKIKIHYDEFSGRRTTLDNIPFTQRDYKVDVYVVDGGGNEYKCSENYTLGYCASSVGLPSHQSGAFKTFDFMSWGDYNANSLRMNNAYNDSMGVVTCIYPRYNIGGHSTSAPYYMRVNSVGDIELVAYGETCYTTNGDLVTPNAVIGVIPKSILDNPNIFDPNSGLKENDIIKTGGGNGGRKPNRNYKGDDIDFPELPTGASALGFGKLNVFKPTDAQLSMALDILWSDSSESTLETIIESAKKWWYKPEQYCTAIMLTPVNPTTSGNKKIYFGKYDSGVSSPIIGSQWQITDCGTLSIPLMYGSYLDYDGTSASIFLPYIGFRPIDIKSIMGGTIAIKYYTDILTGSSVCFLKVSNIGSNSSVLYSYECNVNSQVPITSNNYNTVISSIMSASMSVATGLATGGISSASALGINAVGNVGNAVSTPNVIQSGNYNCNNGCLGNEKPYVCITFPVSIEDSNYTQLNGKSSMSTGVVGDYKGYTVFNEIHLDNIDLPNDVKTEIESQLKSGVIL